MTYSSLIHQKSYEKIVYNLRRHVVNFVPYVFFIFILLGMGAGVFYFLNTLFPSLFLKNNWQAAILLLSSVYLLAIWLFFYTAFIDYYLDVWIVTNDRIIDIRQSGLFGRTIAELDLFRVQDVTSECKGFFATIFNYGNVYIQTAGAKQRFTFVNVPDPHHIREAIVRMADEDRKYHAGSVN